MKFLCSDGAIEVDERKYLEIPFFRKLLNFEGVRPETRLSGFCLEDCRLLQGYATEDPAVRNDDENLERVHDVLCFMASPEASLSLLEFKTLEREGLLKTADREAARRIEGLGQTSSRLCFLGLIQRWRLPLGIVWDLFLGQCCQESFLSEVCALSKDGVVDLSPSSFWDFGFSPDGTGGRVSGNVPVDIYERMKALVAEMSPEMEDCCGGYFDVRDASRALRQGISPELCKEMLADLVFDGRVCGEKRTKGDAGVFVTSPPGFVVMYIFEWALVKRRQLE